MDDRTNIQTNIQSPPLRHRCAELAAGRLFPSLTALGVTWYVVWLIS